ncbi:MAG: hypothetical protein WAQ57_03385 [Candidatus Saccharimonadales bacterium]
MAGTKDSLPHEATVVYRVDKEMATNRSIQRYLEELAPEEAKRFREFMHHIGYIMFMDGAGRPIAQENLQVGHQAVVLNHETDLFLQGAAALSDYLDEE